jgi:hypothetical protein
LGRVESSVGIVLLPLLEKSVVRVQGVTLLPLSFSKKQAKGSSTVPLGIFLNIFGSLEFAEAVGSYMSANAIFLQHPKYPDSGYPYKNPHIFSRRFENIITENRATGGIPAPSKSQSAEPCTVVSEIVDPLDFFENIFKSTTLEEVNADWRITTELLR